MGNSLMGKIVRYNSQVFGEIAAIVTFVHSENLVNLCCFSPNGSTFAATSVVLSDSVEGSGALGEWFYVKNVG